MINLEIITAPTMSLVVPSMFVETPNPRLTELASEAAIKMYNNDGIGIALPQVDYNLSVMILSSEIEKFGTISFKETRLELPDNRYCYVLVNPKIKKKSNDLVDLLKGEGCLSFPISETGEVDRYSKIEIKYNSLDGKSNSVIVDSHIATIIQHEADHLFGILFTARMKSKKQQMINQKYCIQHGINYDLMGSIHVHNVTKLPESSKIYGR